MMLKLIVLLVAATIAWHLFNIWRAGRSLSKNTDAYMLGRHRSMVACVACLITLVVVLIEVMVRISPDPYSASQSLMIFHLAVVAAASLVFIAIVFRFTGLKSPKWHGTLAYSFFALFFVAVGSGVVMLYQLPL